MKALCLILLLGVAAVRVRGEAQPPPLPASPAPFMGPANPTQEALDTDAELTGRTLMTKAELLYAIETTLALNNLAIVPVDGKSIWAGYISERRKLEKDSPATAKLP